MKHLVLPLLAICLLSQPLSAAEHKPGEIVMETASLSVPGADAIPYELGTLYVPENRADPKSRIIGVGFARFRATQGAAGLPTFHLPGGPGNSFLKALKGSAAYVNRYRAIGDVVFVDQRGFSELGDILKFKRMGPQPLDQPASLDRSTATFAEAARATVAECEKNRIDLRGYTVTECADDVDDLRKALGYERIALVGVSFGSQWSFALMRRHPDTVVRALLGGIEPLDCGYDMPSHILAALRRQWWQAEKTPALRPYLPPGGLQAAANKILDRLEQAPLRVEVRGNDRDKPATVAIGPDDFRKHFVGIAGNPALLLALYYERYDEWARAVLAERQGAGRELPLIGPLIDTSLGVTPRRGYLLRTDPATALLGQWNFDAYLATADIWPTADVGDDFRNEVVNQIPVVFVQGDWDVQTPVENLLEVTPYFAKSRTLIVENGGHNALSMVFQRHAAAGAALIEFLKSGSTDRLPVRVTLPAPTFAAPSFPPPAAAKNVQKDG